MRMTAAVALLLAGMALLPAMGQPSVTEPTQAPGSGCTAMLNHLRTLDAALRELLADIDKRRGETLRLMESLGPEQLSPYTVVLREQRMKITRQLAEVQGLTCRPEAD